MNTQQLSAEVQPDRVTIVRRFDATPELVWREWTVPERFSTWFGTPPLATPQDTISMDVRPGGSWTATMVSPDGATKMPFLGVYREVDRPRHLALTMLNPEEPEDPNVESVTIDLSEVDGGTEMRFTQSGHLPAEQYGLLAVGYGGFFDRLDEDLRTQKGSDR